jgi:hypothetical protein
VRVAWADDTDIPTVVVTWEAGHVLVTERFWCPDRSTPRLVRDVRLQATNGRAGSVTLTTGCRGRTIEYRAALSPDPVAACGIEYTLSPDRASVALARTPPPVPDEETARWWREHVSVAGLAPDLDAVFRCAARQLPAVISRTGAIDASIWQYNREWVRDHSFMAHGLTSLGHHDHARAMLGRLLREFITPDGAPMDSSERRAPEETELDQNGILLVALHDYAAWSGDVELCEQQWPRIEALAEYPLLPVFRHERSGLLCNRRDFWERHAAHGIEPGIELAHQVFVALGLEAAAAMARRVGFGDRADRWTREASRLRHAVLHDPVFALVDARGLIKRRGLNGAVQERIVPRADAGLPAGVPLAEPIAHPLNPDSAAALAIAFDFLPASSAVARRTLDELETLWNQGWSIGGYGRYHRDSEPDAAGPWPFATVYIARACLDAGLHDRAWRAVQWLRTIPGSASGAWFELHGPRVSPPYAQIGIIPWAWAEVVELVVRHVLGVRPGLDAIRIRPRRLGSSGDIRCRIPLRGCWMDLSIGHAAGSGPRIATDAAILSDDGDEVVLAYPGRDFSVAMACEP